METLFNSPDKYTKHDETIDGYKTHFIEAGDPANDRLLLVHGGSAALGAGLYRWYPTVLPLAEKLHVFAVDELGHGFTDPPRDIADLGHVRVRAEHVIRFIEEKGLAPLNLCGQSQGGWIVTYITITRPDLVKRLVLVDSGSTAGSGFKTGAGERRGRGPGDRRGEDPDGRRRAAVLQEDLRARHHAAQGRTAGHP